MNDPPPNVDPLPTLRKQIDDLDEQIVALLNQRAKVVVQIGQHKQRTSAPIYAPDREKRVLERVRQLNAGPLPDRCLEAVYRELMSGSFALEKPLRIAFAGPAGNFSHAAAVRKFGSSVEYAPVASVASVFEEVARGHADHGIVPMEDSLHGGLAETLDAFQSTTARICAEVLIQLHLHLLSGCAWSEVTRVVAAPEAVTRCRRWLAQAAGSRAVDTVADSSLALRRAAEEAGVAAIAPRATDAFDTLRPLFADIEDNPEVVSRFFVIARESAKPSGDDKTAIMFTTAHRPGALADVLDVFKDAGINLTDIERRPSPNAGREYFFFIDVQGHADDATMTAAIDAARKHCLQLAILGSYPRAAEVL